MSNYTFPKDFLWGVAGSAFQMEGAMREGGKTLNASEAAFYNPETNGRFQDKRPPDVNCDFYHKYPEDLALFKELGVNTFRFSIAWARIIPEKDAAPYQAGIDYYNALVDEMLKNGITPFFDLWHSDLPQWVKDNGGLLSEEFPRWYLRYAEVCLREFGDRVKYWSTVNEPMLMVFAPYSTARCMPFHRNNEEAFQATHNMILAHFSATRALREISPDGKIGMVNNFAEVYSLNFDPEDVEACERRVAMYLTLMEPIVKGEYPPELVNYKNTAPYFTEKRKREVKEQFAPMDFIGMNCYCPKFARNDDGKLFGNVPIAVDLPKDAYGFVSYAPGLFDALVRLNERYDGMPIFVTENGYTQNREDMNNMDLDQFQHDQARINYIREHVRACARALKAGVNLKGYFYWSFIDTWEVKMGFSVPMGLVGINFDTLERRPRDSFYYYQKVIATNSVD